MQFVGRFLPHLGAMKTDRHTGTHTSGLGSRVAEVAGDDCHGGVYRMVRIQIHGRVFTAGKEDRIRLTYNQSKSSIIDAILGCQFCALEFFVRHGSFHSSCP